MTLEFFRPSSRILAIVSSTAFAGGPVIVEEEVEVVAEKSGSSVGILPIIIIGVALCAALCGGNDDNPREDS